MAKSARVRSVVAALALVGLAATGLVAVLGGQVEADERHDVAVGERLEATLTVRLQRRAGAEASATLRLTNTSGEAAGYRGTECAGPRAPTIAPQGVTAERMPPTSTLRAALIAQGELDRIVTLGRDDGGFCPAIIGTGELAPGASVSWDYSSNGLAVDRSSTVVARTRIAEVDGDGRPLGRLRLAVEFDGVTGARATTIPEVVDAFLADPEVATFVADGSAFGTQIHREPSAWRIALVGQTVGRGQLWAMVQADSLEVTGVDVEPGPRPPSTTSP